MSGDFKQKTVVITGAGAGIGLECARSFARRGARLGLMDVNAQALDAAKRELVEKGAEVVIAACDVTNEENVNAAAKVIQDALGPTHVLINNAGIGYMGAFMDTPVDAWRRVLDINVLGIVHVTRAFLPAMRSAGGQRKIVNIASTAGFVPVHGLSAYVASKHAVVGLSEVLAVELMDTELSILIVAPGIINTDIVRNRSTISPSISEAQIETVQTYYTTHGCHPSVVAEDIVRAIRDRRPVLTTGPSAASATTLARISRRMTRKLAAGLSKKFGYA
jgi:short-subunit dehydrogenase